MEERIDERAFFDDLVAQSGLRRGNGGNNNGGFNNNQNNTTGPTMTFRINVQNLLNNVQYNNFSGTMTSSFFGRANNARNPRQIE